MELTTFGALLQFALELEGTAVQFYEEAAKVAQQAEVQEDFQTSAGEGKRYRKKLERMRRENVNEMLLESFQGLEGKDYRMELGLSPDMGDGELRALALQLEGALERFYRDAAGRLSLPEVARGLARLAEVHAQRKAGLGEI
ncbi:MAG: ferritin-like domain-containing protein [Candidatus Bipolaricaulia bacterium]